MTIGRPGRPPNTLLNPDPRHVLGSQDMSWDPETCLETPKHVLGSRDMSWDPKTCLGIPRHVLGSQDMSRDPKTCFGVSRHVSGSQDMSWDPKTCLGSGLSRVFGGRPGLPIVTIFYINVVFWLTYFVPLVT